MVCAMPAAELLTAPDFLALATENKDLWKKLSKELSPNKKSKCNVVAQEANEE